MQSPQVLVVGSGPAGLAAALSLTKNGISVRIIEKDPQHHNGFRGSGVHPRTQEIEYFLGVFDDVKKNSFEAQILHVYDPKEPYKKIKSQRLVEKFDPTPAFPFTEPFGIAQYRHQAVWRDHLERLGVKVELGAAATAVEQDESGVMVDITRSSGGTEVKEKAKFAYVIGTDGGHSTVRKALGLSFIGETREAEKSYIADVRVKGFTEHGIHNFGQIGKSFALIRYAGEPGRYQVMLGGPQTDFALLNANRDVATLHAEFQKLTNRPEIEFSEVLWQAEWRPNIRMAERFRVGRVFIAGDAAHAHSPAGGQGMNSSIADTFNLGWKLALVLKGQAQPSLLESYELERIPIITEMLQLSTSLFDKMIGKAVQRAKEVASAQAQQQQQQMQQKEKEKEKEGKEGEAMWNSEENGFARGWKLFQLDLNYRHSPIVNDDRFAHVDVNINPSASDAYGERGHDVRAGDRAPDAPGLITLAGALGEGQSIRLFDLFSPTTHTVLVFSSSTTDDETRTRRLTQPVLSAVERLAPGLVRTALIVRGDAEDAHVPYSAEVDYVLKDVEGHAFRGYGLAEGGSAVVVVRPDTYIGAFALGADGVRRYLDAVFGRVDV